MGTITRAKSAPNHDALPFPLTIHVPDTAGQFQYPAAKQKLPGPGEPQAITSRHPFPPSLPPSSLPPTFLGGNAATSQKKKNVPQAQHSGPAFPPFLPILPPPPLLPAFLPLLTCCTMPFSFACCKASCLRAISSCVSASKALYFLRASSMPPALIVFSWTAGYEGRCCVPLCGVCSRDACEHFWGTLFDARRRATKAQAASLRRQACVERTHTKLGGSTL